MSEAVPTSEAAATAEDFEFAALEEAKNYRAALIREFRAFLKGDVLEIGAGIGQITRHLLELPEIKRLASVEPDSKFCAKHRQQFPDYELYEGTVEAVAPDQPWDALLSINVLEHIGDDQDELRRYAGLLRASRGMFCLLVPARQEIYAPIDRSFGHFRRYDRPQLRQKLETAGFEVVQLYYFNFVGYFAWWLNFTFLGKQYFEPGKVRFYDRVIFPLAYRCEANLLRPPFGQSLIAIARATA
jgi:SAM-dependent methyltransferase